jgi:hypothetical protein
MSVLSAKNWVYAQMHPTSNLVQSYGSLPDLCYLTDQAAALLLATTQGDNSQADQLKTALTATQKPSGMFPQYSTRATPTPSSTTRAFTQALCLIALLYHRAERPGTDTNIISALNALTSLQFSSGILTGALRTGDGITPGDSTPINTANTAATALAALAFHLAAQLINPSYISNANAAMNALNGILTNPNTKRFYRFHDGTNPDPRDDAQTNISAALASIAHGDTDPCFRALQRLELHHQTGGFAAQSILTGYEETHPTSRSLTGFASLAHELAGANGIKTRSLSELETAQTSNGAIPDSAILEFHTANATPSIGATAWYAIASSDLTWLTALETTMRPTSTRNARRYTRAPRVGVRTLALLQRIPDNSQYHGAPLKTNSSSLKINHLPVNWNADTTINQGDVLSVTLTQADLQTSLSQTSLSNLVIMTADDIAILLDDTHFLDGSWQLGAGNYNIAFVAPTSLNRRTPPLEIVALKRNNKNLLTIFSRDENASEASVTQDTSTTQRILAQRSTQGGARLTTLTAKAGLATVTVRNTFGESTTQNITLEV